jgi:proline iminopeptidase
MKATFTIIATMSLIISSKFFFAIEMQAQKLSGSILKETEGYVQSEGVDIYYRTFGQGEPLLIINGGPGINSNGFAPLARAMANNRMTVIFDQRGTGKSQVNAPSSENIKMDLMLADIEALRKHLKISQWAVLGHSFGGMLAAYYASTHSQNISKLIFSSSGGLDMELFSYLDITAKLNTTQKDSLQYWTERFEQGDQSHEVLLGRGRALAPAYLEDTSYITVIAERLTEINFNINQLVFEDLQTIEFDCKKQLSAFSSPTLIIQGVQDIIDEATAVRTKKVIPHAEIILLQNCGHYGWLDQKVQYFEAIENFLNTDRM